MESQQTPSPYQQIPQGYSTPPNDFGYSQQRSISLIAELSPTQHLRNIMKELEGYLWDERTDRYIKIDGAKPLMNEEGRDMFFHFATASISPIVTMSNYRTDTERVHKLVFMQVKKASIHFHLMWKDYGISRKTKINIITDKLMILALSSFYKALGAGDRSAATRNISESINRSMNERPMEPQHLRKPTFADRWRNR